MNKLTKLYETINNDERIKLFLLAMARKDNAEVDLLEDTCPRKRYVMADYGFTTHKVDALVMTSMHMLDSYRSMTIALVALATMFLLEDRDSETSSEADDKAHLAFTTAMSKFKAKEQAWHEFCEEIGIDPKVMREAFCIDVLWEDEGICSLLTPLSAEILPSQEEVKMFKSQLHGIWER